MTGNTLFQVLQTRNKNVLNKFHLFTVDSLVPHRKFRLRTAEMWCYYYLGFQSFRWSQECIIRDDSCLSRIKHFQTGENFDAGSQPTNLPCQKFQYFLRLKWNVTWVSLVGYNCILWNRWYDLIFLITLTCKWKENANDFSSLLWCITPFHYFRDVSFKHGNTCLILS